MRVNQAQRTSSSRQGKQVRRAGASGKAFEPSRGGATRRAVALSGPAGVSSIDALVALQAVEDSTERRRRAIDQGSDVLESLDELKIALLSGHETPARLARLKALVERYEEGVEDPGLAEILRQIDLRARVELAKLEKSKGSRG